MFEIRPYQEDLNLKWDEFLGKARNSTFLFSRNYLGYHKDRFKDFSLMFFSKDKLLAVLPSNIDKDTLYSHQGLTYGGLISSDELTTSNCLKLFEELNSFLKSQGIKKVVYKRVPWIYCKRPQEEDLYALFRVCGAKLLSREISTTISLENKLKWSPNRKEGIKKAIKQGVIVEKDNDFKAFWDILEENLRGKYGTKPVHSLKEIELLASRFKDNISLYTAKDKEKTLAGVLLYFTDKVVHTQYISASKEGKSLGAIDLIMDHLLNKELKPIGYFDFGKSTEQSGLYLNENLIFQKEGFGGRGLCYDTYMWEL